MTRHPSASGRALAVLGPGLAVAATGVGAGDLVAAASSGARFGVAVLWACVVGAVLKFALNEGIARWQLATGASLLEGWARHLGRPVQLVFLVYLLLWTFVVGGALIAACGLAAHALVPALSLETWGVVHTVAGVFAVLVGGYAGFERAIKVFIAVMFVALVGSAAFVVDGELVRRAAVEAAVPEGGIADVLGVIGGVGGSVTLLSYGYWMRERGFASVDRLRDARLDLGVAYALTGVFGAAVVVLATRALHAEGIVVEGRDGVLEMADMLASVMGPAGGLLFKVGFWGAVATSLLGVWQGVPYLFADFVSSVRGDGPERRAATVSTRSFAYRAFLAWLAGPPIALLFLDRPVAVVRAYAALGALFMPFLAATLLYLNARRDLVPRGLRNGPATYVALAACIALFGYLGYVQIVRALGG